MTFIKRIGRFIFGLLYNEEEIKIIKAMHYHAGHKKYYDENNPYMSDEFGDNTDWIPDNLAMDFSVIYQDSSSSNIFDDQINPSTGFSMCGGVDVMGNAYGTNSSSHHSSYDYHHNHSSYDYYNNTY